MDQMSKARGARPGGAPERGRTVTNSRWFSTVASAAALVTLIAVSGCGGGGGGDTGTAAGGGSTTGAEAPTVHFKSVEQNIPDSYPQPKPGKYHFAYLNPVGGNEFLHTLGAAMRLETQKLGGTYTELDAKGDVNTQVSQFDQLIAQKVDGIAVFALDPGSVAPEVKRAQKAGIPLVTIDLDFSANPNLHGFDTQVLQRRDEAAYLGAQEMAKQAGSGASVGTIDFAVKVPSIVFSINRGKYWAQQFGLKVSGNASNPSDDIAGGEKAMTQLLGKFPDIKGVIAYNDPSAIGAASAARSQGNRSLVLGGQNGGSDALEAIKAGRESYSVKLDAPSMGKDFAWALFDLKEGVKVPKSVKAGKPVIVTKDNVDSQTPWDQQLKQEYPQG
jgi:ribose transport system substrate-binding protein